MWSFKNPFRAEPTPATDSLNRLDMAFVVDTTGSMGPFLDAARRQMLEMIRSATAAADVDLRLGLVEYRDHPPQDKLVYRTYPLDGSLATMQRTIAGLSASGGGDEPEAVLDGVLAACREMAWAPHARRLAVLVGDAPPHGVGYRGDQFREGCPCGQTIESVTAAAEESRVTLYALGLTPAVADSFKRLACYTGGEFFPAGHGDAAIEKLRGIIVAEFGNLQLDGQVLGEWKSGGENFAIDATAQKLAIAPGAVSASLVRLGARRLLDRTPRIAAGMQ
jgi:hypothetical protein